jgi:hypothetical protein
MDTLEPSSFPDPTPWLGGAACALALATAGALAVYPDLVLVVGLAAGSLILVALTWLSALVVAVRGRSTVVTWAAAIVAPLGVIGAWAAILQSGFPGAPGRPVRRGRHRRLPPVTRGRPVPQVNVDERARADLVGAWVEAGRAEASSVVAFRELADDLRRLGAPASLVERADRAAADEVRHAREAFAVASRLAGVECAPLPLALEPRGPLDLAELAVACALDGAYGEGCAAREAAAAAAAATDPEVAAHLAAVAVDEAEHALLGLDVARWAAARGGRRVWWGVAAALVALRIPARPPVNLPAGWSPAESDPRRAVRAALRRSWAAPAP